MPNPSLSTSSEPVEVHTARLRAQWTRLPESLRTENQICGRTGVGCAATHHVMERCDFGCTCCYLSKGANRTPPLPFAEVKAQLDAIRAHLGPGGKTQITAGEVTLLPVDELGRIVAYARSIGLDPMVMTHGQRFLREPAYLRTLVKDYGLQRVSIHIDITQKGRDAPFDRPQTESDLNLLRDRFAALIRRIRSETGCLLTAASTVTVTTDNIDQMGPVIQWFLKNADAFRLVNFLPVATVGRTRANDTQRLSEESLRLAFDLGVGFRLNRTPLHFGHPACNLLLPLVVIDCQDDRAPIVLEGVRDAYPWDARFLARMLDGVGARIDWTRGLSRNLPTIAGCLLKRPALLVEAVGYGAWRGLCLLPALLRATGRSLRKGKRFRVRPFMLSAHRFMSPNQMQTSEGLERLEACIFKVPVDGEMIPMCTMNAEGVRERIGARLRGESVPTAAAR
ncbi:MAG: hypothetical protein ACFBZ8_03490 [Opitutales bacterium]